MIIFLLTEQIGYEKTEHIIFPKDRQVLSFGRSPLAEYRLLVSRTDAANRKISRIQATLEQRSDEWYLCPGCTEKSARGDIVPARPGSPLWIGDREVIKDLKMSIGLSVYLYRENDDHALLHCVDEATLEHLSCPSNRLDDTQPYDLLGDLQDSLQTLETSVAAGFAEMRESIETLSRSDRIQSKQIDTQRRTYTKLTLAATLCVLAIFSGSQLLDPNHRKDLFYDLIKFIISTGSGTSAIALLKNAMENRRPIV